MMWQTWKHPSINFLARLGSFGSQEFGFSWLWGIEQQDHQLVTNQSQGAFRKRPFTLTPSLCGKWSHMGCTWVRQMYRHNINDAKEIEENKTLPLWNLVLYSGLQASIFAHRVKWFFFCCQFKSSLTAAFVTRALVCLNMMITRESLAANRAVKGFLPSVRSRVPDRISLSNESFTANCTGKGFLSCVDFGMSS